MSEQETARGSEPTPKPSSDTKVTFNFSRIASDSEGYYYDRWDQAVPISVIAANEKEAQAKAFAISGRPPSGRFWKLRLKGISEVSNG